MTDRTDRLFKLLALSLLAIAVGVPACREWGRRHHELAAPKHQGPEHPRDLKFEPLKVCLPEVHWVDLPNGAVLCLLSQRDNVAVPLVTVRATVRAGAVYDTPEQRGIANLTAEVMKLGGTQSLPGAMLARELERLGAGLEVSVDQETVSLEISGHSRHIRKYVEILTDLLLRPLLTDENLAVCKTLLAETFRRENDRAGAIVTREMMRAVFPDHPYGWRSIGEPETVAAFTLADVKNFHRRFYTPDRIVLGVAGVFDIAETQKDLTERLSTADGADCKEDREKQALKPPPPAPAERKVLAVYKDLPQASIGLGHIGVPRNHPDYFPLIVLNSVLGGGAISRLRDVVRTKLGLTYAVSGRFSFYLESGLFAVLTSTKTASVKAAIRAILDELERIKEEEVSAHELALAKDHLVNSFLFRFETPAETLSEFMTLEIFGLPRNYLERFRDNVAGVSAADVQRVAQTHLRPEAMYIVVVGKIDTILEDLASFGPVTVIPLSEE